MKRLKLMVLLLTGALAGSYAQQITSGEYFIGNDPGNGNGTAFAFSAGDNISTSLQVPLGGLSEGFQTLSIRVKNTDGKWSHYAQRGMYVLLNANQPADILTGEYFFNQDPGVGNGTPIVLTSGNSVTAALIIPEGGLPAGLNSLSIRVKNSSGKWSQYAQRLVFVVSGLSVAANITAGEFYIDADPGLGNATAISVSPGSIIQQSFGFPISGLADGFHTLAVRFKGSDGHWGLYTQRLFFVATSSTDAQQIIAAEYFIDADPGIGQGEPLAVNPQNAAIQQTFVCATPPGLAPGQHFLYIRTQNNQLKWSAARLDTFNIESGLPVTALQLWGSLQQEQIVVKWSTLTESNSDYFTVERSGSGINFASIGKVQAMGNSNRLSNYDFNDASPLPGKNYYRLQQFDKDGKYVYSNIIVVDNNPVQSNFAIWPNPANAFIKLGLETSPTAWMATIYDAGGKFVKIASLQNSATISLNGLAPGSYFISVTNGIKQFNGRFIKQ